MVFEGARVSECSPEDRGVRDPLDLPGRLRVATGGWHLRVERQLGLPGSIEGVADYVRLLRFWLRLWSAGEPLLQAAAPAALPAASAVGLLVEDLADLGGCAQAHGWTDAQGLADGHGRADAHGWADVRAGKGAVGERHIARAPLNAAAAWRGPLGGPAPSAMDPGPGGVGLPEAGIGVWGVAYVLQGSRLGGRVLGPALGARAGLPAGVGTRFLLGGGQHGDLGAEWAGFRARLRRVVPEPSGAAADLVVAGAEMTFGFVAELAGQFGWPAAAEAGASGAAPGVAVGADPAAG